MKRNHCQACTFLIHGVKTRKSIPHTCGKTYKEILEMVKIETLSFNVKEVKNK